MIKYDYQLRALKRWEFEKLHNGEYHIVINNLEVQWCLSYQCGAYIIDGVLTLLHNWDELDDIMQQTEIY